MKKLIPLLILLAFAVVGPTANAVVIIEKFPGWKKLTSKADAIVVLQVEHVAGNLSPEEPYYKASSHILQTLKGDISPGSRLNFELIDTVQMHYPTEKIFGTHLAFLRKVENADKELRYRSLEFEGSIVQIAPDGHRWIVADDSIDEQVKQIVDRAIVYFDEAYQARRYWLNKLITHNEVFARERSVIKPGDSEKHNASQPCNHEKATRSWLGVYVQPVPDSMAQALKLEDKKGALVAKVEKRSPAAEAGILSKDVILRFDKKQIDTNTDLPTMVAQTPIGAVVDVELLRGEKRDTVKVKIAKFQAKVSPSQLGFMMDEVTPEVATSLGLPQVKGFLIIQVEPNSVAEKSGLRRGDVILEIDSKVIATSEDYAEVSAELLDAKRPILFLIRRGDGNLFLTWQ